MHTVYIGYDPREDLAYKSLVHSIKLHASKDIQIVALKKNILEDEGLYTRKSFVKDGQQYDCIDQRPFSTEFSFTRFLIPFLNQFSGKALFMDSDMFMRADICELFSLCSESYPLWCVHHKYDPPEGIKMDGQIQQSYQRKNWSSLMLFQCDHPAHKNLTLNDVNTKPGRWLHRFSWISDKAEDIGQISEEWNWLDGHSSEKITPKNVHFTTGGPWFKEWHPKRAIDSFYAKEWKTLASSM